MNKMYKMKKEILELRKQLIALQEKLLEEQHHE